MFVLFGVVLILSVSGQSSALQVAPSAEALVAELGQFQAALPAMAPSTGVPPPMEARRAAVYDALWTLGPTAVPALARGLSNADQVRRNVALFLNAAGGNWYENERPRLDIRGCSPALIAALSDPDARVRALAAQALGAIGPEASAAVPALIVLLGSSDEGSRNSACIGLAGIGPLAKEALPALRRALDDSSRNVRGFAQRAIDRISR
jgi:HEAT repeat protein